MVVIYALGGGAGHLARATAFAKRCRAGQAVTLFHSAPAPTLTEPCAAIRRVPIAITETPAQIRQSVLSVLSSHQASELVVDSFPGGILRELDDALLARASRRTLIRRFVKPLSYVGYAGLAGRYDEFVFPYDAAKCEWDGEDELAALPIAQRYVGPLVRSLSCADGAPKPCVVIGRPETLHPGLRFRLPSGTAFAEDPLRQLPAARGYLATGAGYNLSYELSALGRPFALVPQERRYDDQFRRAALLGKAVHGVSDLDRFLSEAA